MNDTEIRLLSLNKAGYEAIQIGLEDSGLNILLDGPPLPDWKKLPILPGVAASPNGTIVMVGKPRRMKFGRGAVVRARRLVRSWCGRGASL